MNRDEQLIRAALDIAANKVNQGNYGPVAGHYGPYDHLTFIEKSIRAIDPAEVLAKVETVPDAVARLVEAAKWVRDQSCEGFCRYLVVSQFEF